MFKVKIQIPEQEFSEFKPETDLGPLTEKMMDEVYTKFFDIFMRGILKELTKTARKNAPVVTGKLKKGIRYKKEGDAWTLVANAAHSRFCEWGTGLYGMLEPPHYIYPKKSRYLVFRGKSGNLVFAKRTRGQKPQLYVTRALEELDQVVDIAWDNMTARGGMTMEMGEESA